MEAAKIIAIIKTDESKYHQIVLNKDQQTLLLRFTQALFEGPIQLMPNDISLCEVPFKEAIEHSLIDKPVNLILYSDGGCLGNGSSGQYAYGSYAVYNGEELLNDENQFPLGSKTNNESEYLSMIKGLNYIKSMPTYDNQTVTAFTDSDLLVKQVLGQWKCKKPHLLPLVYQLRELIKELNVSLQWVPREKIVEILGH